MWNSDDFAKELEIKIVRLEEKIDHIIDLLNRLNGNVKDHEERIRSLERDRNKLFGIGVSGFISGITAIIKTFFKL